MEWIYRLKMDAVTLTGLSKDSLHIHIALLAFFAACVLFRWKAGDGKAVLLVLIVELLNEVSDLRYTTVVGGYTDWAGSVHDIINTMTAPILLFAMARWTTIFSPPRQNRPEIAEKSGDQPQM